MNTTATFAVDRLKRPESGATFRSGARTSVRRNLDQPTKFGNSPRWRVWLLVFSSLIQCVSARAQETNLSRPQETNALTSQATNAPAPQETNAPTRQETNASPRIETNVPTRQPTNASTRLDFSSFRIITERNIFDPNRGPAARRSAQRSGTRRPARRAEAFSLVGTAISEEGAVAFFDGTGSQYQKMLKPSETIANFQVVEIAPHHVKLRSEGKEVTLLTPPDQTQMRKQEDGAWELVAGAASTDKSASASDAGESTVGEKSGEAPAEKPTGNTASDEILRKLMEQREKELKNEKP